MKYPWKEILIAFLIGGIVGWFAATRSFGCFGHHPHGKRGHFAEKFERELGLTPDQSQKVRAVFESKRSQFKEIQQSSQKEIEKILTPEQLPAFKKMQAEWQARRDKWRENKEDRD